MTFCLNRNITDKLKFNIKNLTPEQLYNLGTEGRRAFFEKHVGLEAAKKINTVFEQSLLKNSQKFNLLEWANQIKEPKIKKTVLDKIEGMTELLTPANEKAFLGSLVEHKLGVAVTRAETMEFAKMGKAVSESKIKMENSKRRESGKSATTEEMAYGREYVKFMNYFNDTAMASTKMGLLESLKHPIKSIETITGAQKSIKAAFDNSAIFRQGWKVLPTHSGIWLKNAVKSFKNIWDTFGGKNVMDELNADIVSNPNYELMRKAKLAVGTIEEAYPSQLLTLKKVPVIGKAYKASETAFTAFVHKTRADVFDKYIELAKESGMDINDKVQLQAIGKMVNSLTGRATLGKAEAAANVVNNVFFSPRFFKSNLDVLTAHQLTKDVTPFVRKQAAYNLAKIVVATGGVLAIANFLKPGSVEWDSHSSDFGKIRIGDSRFDVTGGMGSIIVLATRIAPLFIGKETYIKSSTTGKKTKLNSGSFGGRTGWDVVVDFMSNKTSPAASVLVSLMRGEDFSGNKPTILSALKDLYVPLPVTNAIELYKNPNSANMLLGVILDGMGLSVNTYSAKPKKTKQLYK